MIIKGHSIHSARQCVGREGCSQDMAGSLCHMFLLTPSSALAWVLLRLQSLQGHLLFHEAPHTSLPLVFLSDCLLCSIFYYLLNTLSQRCHQAWLVGSLCCELSPLQSQLDPAASRTGQPLISFYKSHPCSSFIPFTKTLPHAPSTVGSEICRLQIILFCNTNFTLPGGCTCVAECVRAVGKWSCFWCHLKCVPIQHCLAHSPLLT